jgi:hypothetical protein
MRWYHTLAMRGLMLTALLLLVAVNAMAGTPQPSKPYGTASADSVSASYSDSASQSAAKSQSDATSSSTSAAVSNSAGGHSSSVSAGGSSQASQHQTANGGNSTAQGGNGGNSWANGGSGGTALNASTLSAEAAASGGSSDNEVTIYGDEAASIPVATAIAGGTNTTAKCWVSRGVGAQMQIFGFSLGGAKKDADCERFELAQFM